MPIPKGKLEPQVAITLLNISAGVCKEDMNAMEEYFNSLCDLYKRETTEDLIK